MKKILLLGILAGYAVIVQAGEGTREAGKSHHYKHHARYHVKYHAGHRVRHQFVHVPDTKAVSEPVREIEQFGEVAEKSDTDLMTLVNSDLFQPASGPKLLSSMVLIYDLDTHRPLYSKNPDSVTPIASITKLMTAMVVLDSKPDLNEAITVSDADLDKLKNTGSRLMIGTTIIRSEMLKLALMSSENRAASALARTYPGGTAAMVAAMNAKAKQLGMLNTTFRDPTGLNSENVSTARDLVKMVESARNYPLIHQYTTTISYMLEGHHGRELLYKNSNPLVKNTDWDIGLSKTGYISEAGHCLVMQAKINQHPVIIVLLDSVGKMSRVGDANRVKKWIESAIGHTIYRG